MWCVTHGQDALLPTAWPSPRPVTVLYETGSKSGEAAHSLSKHTAYLVVVFLWSLRQEVLIIKQPKLVRVELAPAWRVVRFQAPSGRPSEEEAETSGRVPRAAGGGRGLVSEQVWRAPKRGSHCLFHEAGADFADALESPEEALKSHREQRGLLCSSGLLGVGRGHQ